jgi:hypothetical protein
MYDFDPGASIDKVLVFDGPNQLIDTGASKNRGPKYDHYQSDATRGSRPAPRVRDNRQQDLRDRLFLVPFAVIAVCQYAGR